MLKPTVYKSFAELPDHSLSFLADIEKENFYLGKGWFENFSANTLTAESSTHIYSIEETGSTTKTRAMIFMRSPGGQNGSLSEKLFSGPKTIASMTAHQSIYFAPSIIGSDKDQEHIIDTLIQSICEDSHSWNLIDFNFMDKNSLVYQNITTALKNCGMHVHHYDYRPNIYEDLTGMTFKDYVASRPSMVRKTYMRKSRKLEKSSDVHFKLVTSDTKELAKAISDYKIIHDKSWKEDEIFPEHDPGVILKAAQAGSLRMGLLYVDDKPVAVQVWLVSSGRATIYKLHYDADFHQQSVGAILMLRMFEHMIDIEHIHEVDFGIGDENAKSLWLKKQRPLCGIVAFNPKTSGGLIALSRYTASGLIDKTKQKIKPLLMPLKQQLTKSTSQVGV